MLRKITEIAIKIFYGLIAVVLLLGLVQLGVKYIPTDKTPIDVNMSAYKVDDEGNQISTVPISISGSLSDYGNQKSRIDADIAPFDGYTDFQEDDLNGITGYITRLGDRYFTTYYATKSSGFEYFDIYFSEDFSRWAFVVSRYTNEDPSYTCARYVGSTNSDDTVTDLVDYFGGFLRIERPTLKTDPALDWQMHGTFIDADGNQQAMDLTITGQIWDYTSKDYYRLDLQIAFPDSFKYQIPTPAAGFSSMKNNTQNTSDLYICSTGSLNKENAFPKDTISTHFAIDIEKEYFIVIFKDAPECYFVASTDDTTSEEILLHFQDFIQKYKTLFW